MLHSFRPGKTGEMSDGCCEWMSARLDWACPDHEDPFDCPDAVLVPIGSGCFALPIHDGGGASIAISYCPGCGSALGGNGGR